MHKTGWNIILILMLGLATACASTTARSRDRLEDAGDIAGFSLDFLSAGLTASAGPVSAGAGVHNSSRGHRSGGDPGGSVHRATLGLGFGCDWLLHREAVGISRFPTPEVPAEYVLRHKQSCTDSDDPEFALYQWGRLQLSLGLGVMGFTVELNWLEFLDFLAGFAGVDFLDDDAASYYERFARESTEAADDPQTSAP